ncbi:MAG: RidA family protein [Methyloligellaceae bacterium]
MPRFYNPASIRAPFSNYTHGVEVPAGARTVYFSGQLGVDPQGNVPEDFAGQLRNVYANIEAILKDGGMELSDLIKMTSFMIRREDIPVAREIRKEVFGDLKPAHTLLLISGLASPEFLIEVEGFACRE